MSTNMGWGRLGWARLALAGLLAMGCASALFPPKTQAQEVAGEAKRKLKSKVLPEYPPIARQLGLVGKVKIETTIAADGHVIGTKIVGGNPVLAAAAQDAVRKWRFEPGPKDSTEIIEVEFSGKE
jgi:TonB family protein